MRLRRYRPMALVLLVLHLSACSTWRPTFVSPQQLIPVERPSSVRATLRSGATVTLENPIVRNDSILGVTDAGVVAVASEDLGLLEVRHFSVLKTIGAVLGGLFAVHLLACLVSDDYADGCQTDL